MPGKFSTLLITLWKPWIACAPLYEVVNQRPQNCLGGGPKNPGNTRFLLYYTPFLSTAQGVGAKRRWVRRWVCGGRCRFECSDPPTRCSHTIKPENRQELADLANSRINTSEPPILTKPPLCSNYCTIICSNYCIKLSTDLSTMKWITYPQDNHQTHHLPTGCQHPVPQVVDRMLTPELRVNISPCAMHKAPPTT